MATHAGKRLGNLGLLLIGFASLLAAIGLWALLVPNEPIADPYEPAVRHDGLYQAGGSVCSPNNLAKLRLTAIGAKQADICQEAAEQHRLQQSDLIQQTRAADGTKAAAALAYSQTKVGAAQAVTGMLTLVAAILAALYARHAALEAGKSADTAERELAAAERPRLLEEEVTIEDLHNVPQGPEGKTSCKYTWKSLGPGIAWARGSMVGHIVLPLNVTPTIEEPIYGPMNWPIPKGKGWGHASLGLEISEEDRVACREGQKRLYLIGAIIYSDGGQQTGRHHYVAHSVYVYRPLTRDMAPFEHPFWNHT